MVFSDRVADLIDCDTHSWNYELLSSTFWSVDVHHILKVPIGCPDTTYRLVWAFLKSGSFTVRSSYHNLLDGQSQAEEGSTTHHGASSLQWDWIWSLKVPPKVRTFLWRTCHGILLTRVAFVHHVVRLVPILSAISAVLKWRQILIYFLNDPFFHSIGMEHSFPFDSHVLAPNFAAGLRWLQAHLDTRLFLLSTIVIWNIWNFRNGYYHGSEVSKRETIIARS